MYSLPRSMRVSARVIATVLPTSCFRQCATNSVAMSRSRWRPRNMTESAKPAPPCMFVIFGAAGDLTKRLLMPALYNLRRSKLLPDDFKVIGVARGDKSDESFRREFDDGMRDFAKGAENGCDWKWLRERIFYLRGDLEDAATYRVLVDKLEKARQQNVLFYLATPPSVFAPVIEHLGQAQLLNEGDNCWRRVIIEKPFGTDLRSAKELNRTILSVMSEKQIFRID